MLRVLTVDLGSGDSQPNPRRFHELMDGGKHLRAACPCLVGLVDASLTALSNHVAHKCFDPDVIVPEAKASQAHPGQEALAKFGVRQVERDG
jgi:hypothetical protein